ncbi:hypothetical protein M422DRAFT_63524 [Sphaerobolus stellatus SS14]|nr:hypothetical protein M422DRAFT_63524 [Sphaerobolus stellatus SS14]
MSKEKHFDGGIPLAWAATAPRTRRSKNLSRFSVIGLLGVAAFLVHRGCIVSPQLPTALPFSAEDANWKILPVGTVKWGPCEGPNTLEGSECGYIIAPLDYLNTDVGVAKIAVSRYQATKKPRKGMVLFNFGGPGGPGVPQVRSAPSFQAAYIGEDYDWVGFDPRGIGSTVPQTRCFAPGGYSLFKRHTVLERGYEVGKNLSDPRTRDRLIEQQREADALYETQFKICNETLGETLKYMGTSTVSRDIDFITTVLEGKNALINFVGFSYGTILGAYLVNMFPERIGRTVIDGVVDPVAWASQPPYKWYRGLLGYTEKTYQLFLSRCSEVGPTVCPLAHSIDEEPREIEARIEDFFDKLAEKPMSVPNSISPGILTSGSARIPLFTALAEPIDWPLTTKILDAAMKGEGKALLEAATGSFYRDLERSAVTCNDNKPFKPPTAEEVIDESLDVLKSVTRFAMSVVVSEPDAGCQFWPVTPPERFQGPWNHTLKNPILIHSNLLDPVTPMSNGELVKKLLGDSATLALREGPGHASLSLPSLCTARVTLKYFSDGTLPPERHLCSVDVLPFPMANETRAFSVEDEKLLAHLTILRQSFPTRKRPMGP